MCLFFNLTQQKERALLREPIVKLLHLADKALIQPVAKKETNNEKKKIHMPPFPSTLIPCPDQFPKFLTREAQHL